MPFAPMQTQGALGRGLGSSGIEGEGGKGRPLKLDFIAPCYAVQGSGFKFNALGGFGLHA